MEKPNESIDTPRIEDQTVVPESNDSLVDQTQTFTAPSHVLNEKSRSSGRSNDPTSNDPVIQHDDDHDEIRVEIDEATAEQNFDLDESSTSHPHAGKTKIFYSKSSHIGIMIGIGIYVLGTSLGALLSSVGNESVFIRGTTLAALAVMPTLCCFAKGTLWTRWITIGIMALFYVMAGYTAAVAGRGFLAFFFWLTSLTYVAYFVLITMMLKNSTDITEK